MQSVRNTGFNKSPVFFYNRKMIEYSIYYTIFVQYGMNQEFVISDEQQLEMYSTYERLSKMKNLNLLNHNGTIQPTL